MNTANFWVRASNARLQIAIAVALLLLLILPFNWSGELRGLLAWNGAALCFLALAWRTILTCDATLTRQLSRREDEHRPVIDALLSFASFASMGGVLIALAHANKAQDGLSNQLTLTSIATVVLSWTLIHTVYAFHYARLYYEGKTGGINFHSDEPPDYLDFCYISFAVATTFGLTDSEVSAREIRRVILKHSVLSFAFASVVVALSLNVVSSLLGA